MVGRTAHEIYSKQEADMIVAGNNEALRSPEPLVVPDHVLTTFGHEPRLAAGAA